MLYYVHLHIHVHELSFVHTFNLEPGETPSYSASRQAPNDVQRSLKLQNILKRCGTVPIRHYFNSLIFSTVYVDILGTTGGIMTKTTIDKIWI